MNTLFQNLPTEIVKINELMKYHTSFKIGGLADYFITPNNIEQLKSIIDICKNNKLNYYIIGNGTNLLVSDKGFRGVIIQLFKNLSTYTINETTIQADAGISLSKLANIALEHNLTGFEFASGIPGTLGGAVYMNAGAYGGEIKQVITNCTVMNNKGEIFTFSKDELELDYRTSIISKKDLIVLNATINLKIGDYEQIKNIMIDLNTQRKTKQPLEFPSAGSAFKRPKDNFAGKLIMEAGLRGFCIGDAQISEKHCGFIINKGNASSNDVINLVEYVKNSVEERFNIKLETEIKFLGDF